MAAHEGGEGKVYLSPAGVPEPTEQETAELDELILKDDQVGEYARAWKERDPWSYSELLKRFFIARKRDTPLAFEMLKNSMLWRIDYKADRLLTHCDEDNKNMILLKNYWPGKFIGVDRRGFPVWIERFGHVDPASLLELVPAEELVHFHLWCQEHIGHTLRQANDALPEDKKEVVLRHIAIEDLDGLGMKHYHSKGLDLLKACVKIDESSYPERLARLYVVNAPTVFRIIWAVVKPWLDPRTLAKINILGSNYTDELLVHIAPEQLPVALGGALDEPLPTNSGTYVDILPSGLPLNPRKTTVGRRDVLNIEFTVANAPARLTWEFSTQDYDISMGLKRGGSDHFVLPIERFDSHHNAVKGTHNFTEAGTFVMVFDNSFSRFTSKTLHYHLTLEPST